jgi:4-coumarate--CoA ligase
VELEHAFNLVHPKLVFTCSYSAKQVLEVAPKFKTDVILLDDPEAGNSFKKFLENPTDEDFMAKDIDINEDVCLILYSSGTTGLPKGVQLTHANLVSTMTIISDISSDIRGRNPGLHEIVFLNVAPWYFEASQLLYSQDIIFPNLAGKSTCIWL